MSKKENTESFACGNFNVEFELAPELQGLPDKVKPLLLAGITQILQRKPASKWEKTVAKYDKRPDGFQRNSIPFSAEAAAELAVIAGEAVADFAVVDVTEYVPTVAEGKMKEEIAIFERHEEAGDTRDWLTKKIGFSGEYEDPESESGYSQAALRALNAWKRAEEKKRLAEI